MNKELKQRYEQACIDYAEAFCEKHELQFEHWIGYADMVGEMFCASDMFINMADVSLDIDNDVPADLYSEWYWKYVGEKDEDTQYINYWSFLLGRVPLKK